MVLLEMLDHVLSNIGDTLGILDTLINIGEAFSISGTIEEALNN